jgi:hypothetical protein
MQTQILLPFQHRAGVRPYTSFINFAESCVFNKQSPPPFFCLFLKIYLFLKKIPSPEVTGLFCRVPSIQFTQTL